MVEIHAGDIIANLPYDDRCAMWFDHHFTNRVEKPFEGEFREAPSAAGIIYDFYPNRFPENRRELVAAADKIDSAELSTGRSASAGKIRFRVAFDDHIEPG